MKKLVSVLGLLGMVILSGCSEEVKSREWYMDHQKERAEIYQKCRESGNDTPNCRNAIDAQFQIDQKNAKPPTFDFNLEDEMKKDAKE